MNVRSRRVPRQALEREREIDRGRAGAVIDFHVKCSRGGGIVGRNFGVARQLR